MTDKLLRADDVLAMVERMILHYEECRRTAYELGGNEWQSWAAAAEALNDAHQEIQALPPATPAGEVAALREALEPFAGFADRAESDALDSDFCVVRLGDCRAARTALEGKPS
jgi:hypothetical protein